VATYYVDVVNGNDAWTGNNPTGGSPNGPKQHITGASGGISRLASGDTLIIATGTYDEAITSGTIPSGTSWSNKTRLAAATGASVWLVKTGSFDYSLDLHSGEHYIEIDGLNIDGSNSTYGPFKIESVVAGSVDTHHIRYQNAEVKSTHSKQHQGCIIVNPLSNTASSGCEFIKLKVHSIGQNDFNHGFYLESSNVLVDGCEVYDVTGAGIQMYNGNSQSPSGFTIRNNLIHDLASATVGSKRHWGITAYGANVSTAEIYNNVIHHIPYDSPDGSYGIGIQYSSGIHISNNTLYWCSGNGIHILPSTSGAVVTNNITNNIAGTDVLDQGSGNTLSFNCLNATDPKFVNAASLNFRLLAASPCLNGGTTVSVVTTDIVGTTRPQSTQYDQGAYEMPVPVVSLLSPNSGAVGATVTITGTGFGPTQGASTVTFFNGKVATATVWSDTSITVTVPTGATTGVVTVTCTGYVSNGVTFTVTGSAPGITLLAHTMAGSGDTFSVTTTGINTVGADLIVVQLSDLPLGGDFCTLTDSQSNTWTALTAYTQATAANSRCRLYYKLVPATSASHTFNATSVNAHYPTLSILAFKGVASYDQQVGAALLSVLSLQPGSLTPSAANALLVCGLTMYGTSSTMTVDSGFTITDQLPWATPRMPAASAYLVEGTAAAVNPTWAGLSAADHLASAMASFLPGPSLASLTPNIGVIGTAVTITGVNFGATQGASTVKFNGVTATPTSWADTSISVPVPATATTGNVVVTVGGVASNGLSFTVILAPSLSSLTPNAGLVGTSVVIAGSNFGATQGASTVTFNGVTATPTSWATGSITVPVPAGATTGPVIVTVGGVASNSLTFTVTVSPVLTSLTPDTAPVTATVVIAGANFGSSQGGSTVLFNGVSASVTAWSNTSITAIVPSTTTGNVIVTVAGNASNFLLFTVVPAPAIVSLTPPSAVVGTTITITGTTFGALQGGSYVTFAGVLAPPTTWSATSITARVPAGASTGNVVVTVAGVASNGVTFTLIPSNTINFEFPPLVSSGKGGDSVFLMGVSVDLIPAYTPHARSFVLRAVDAQAIGVPPGGYEHTSESANGDWTYSPLRRG